MGVVFLSISIPSTWPLSLFHHHCCYISHFASSHAAGLVLSGVHVRKVFLLTFQHGSVALKAGLGQKCTVTNLKIAGVVQHVKHLNDVNGVKT
jgi:hypothetical protein